MHAAGRSGERAWIAQSTATSIRRRARRGSAAHLQLRPREPLGARERDSLPRPSGARNVRRVSRADDPVLTVEPPRSSRLNVPGGRSAPRGSGQRPRARRDELRRLEHHRVAVRERRRDLPRRDREREVPGRDDPDDAERPRLRRCRPGPDRALVLAAHLQRLAGEELEDPRGALRSPMPLWPSRPSPGAGAEPRRSNSSDPTRHAKRSATAAFTACSLAAWTAASTCAASPIANSPSTSERSEDRRRARRPRLDHAPPTKFR